MDFNFSISIFSLKYDTIWVRDKSKNQKKKKRERELKPKDTYTVGSLSLVLIVFWMKEVKIEIKICRHITRELEREQIISFSPTSNLEIFVNKKKDKRDHSNYIYIFCWLFYSLRLLSRMKWKNQSEKKTNNQ